MTKAKSANGVRGHLLNLIDGIVVFRVYDDDDHNFVDYVLDHSDLTVVIDDEDAYFYRDKQGDKLDHAPRTLGLTQK